MKNIINRLNPYKNYLKRLSLFVLAGLLLRYLHLFVNEHLWHFYFPMGRKIDDPTGELLVYALVLLFAWIMRKQFVEFKDYKYKGSKWFSTVYLLLSIAVLAVPMSLFEGWHITQIFYYFVPLFLSYIFLYLAIFGRKFVVKFKNEHILVTATVYIYLWFSLSSMAYWKVFSFFTLKTLSLVLAIFTQTAHVNTDTLNVVVEKFSVHIGAPCAGLYSLFLFVMFYILSLYLNRKKGINYPRAAIVFVLGFAALFLLNVLRIAIILLVGGYYSEALAINIFHEYLGAVLFIFFMYIYLWYALPLIIIHKAKSK